MAPPEIPGNCSKQASKTLDHYLLPADNFIGKQTVRILAFGHHEKQSLPRVAMFGFFIEIAVQADERHEGISYFDQLSFALDRKIGLPRDLNDSLRAIVGTM